MPGVEVIEKKKGTLTCGSCGSNLAAGTTKCQNCGSTNIKKGLIVVRKASADVADDVDLEEFVDGIDEGGEEDELEDEAEDEDELVDEDEGEEEYEDDEEGTLVDEDELAPLSAVGKRVAAVEVLNLGTALAENICKVFDVDHLQAPNEYERVMTEFNAVIDNAAASWLTGATVSKADTVDGQVTLIQERIGNITKKEGNAMPDVKRPNNLDEIELPDDVKAYINGLEGAAGIEKRDPEEIYKGLDPSVVETIKKSAEIVEQNEANKYLEIAKGFKHLPGDKSELAVSLRKTAAIGDGPYKTLIDTLTAANENLKQSDVFKQYGAPGGGEPADEISKRDREADELVKKGAFPTKEQALVSLMDGRNYRPTTAV